MIRPLVPDDAAELARLLTSNRGFLTPFQPEHAEEFFSPEGQRRRIEAAEHPYAIVDDHDIAGVIALSNLVRGPIQSANLGYWSRRRGTAAGYLRIAGAWRDHYLFQRTAED
jgi:[ribosomal protein S5]-alanine N-acetyltransferase